MEEMVHLEVFTKRKMNKNDLTNQYSYSRVNLEFYAIRPETGDESSSSPIKFKQIEFEFDESRAELASFSP